jgi:hypothetical protein
MKTMIRFLVLFLFLPSVISSLVSCRLKPTVAYGQTGQIRLATLGGSLMTKVKGEAQEIVLPDGTRLSSVTEEADETVVPNTYIKWKALGPLITGMAKSMVKGTHDPNVIPKDPNVIPKDPNVIPVDPNILP